MTGGDPGGGPAGGADARVVLTACGTPAAAEALARALVAEELAACVQIVPGVRSHYRWRGEVRDADECLLLVKTTRAGYAALAARLAALHPYELPELLALDVAEGSAAYLAWLTAGVQPPARPPERA